MSDNLTGSFHVRATFGAFADADRLFNNTKDAIELRRHALKLRYWPANNPVDHSGQVIDLDWSWIRAMPQSSVGELRINDSIGGHDNLRVIFSSDHLATGHRNGASGSLPSFKNDATILLATTSRRFMLGEGSSSSGFIIKRIGPRILNHPQFKHWGQV